MTMHRSIGRAVLAAAAVSVGLLAGPTAADAAPAGPDSAVRPVPMTPTGCYPEYFGLFVEGICTGGTGEFRIVATCDVTLGSDFTTYGNWVPTGHGTSWVSRAWCKERTGRPDDKAKNARFEYR